MRDRVFPADASADQWVRWRYYAYRFTVNNGFFLPVGILYIERQGLGLDAIAFTQGVFLLALVAFQLPSGYIGDRIGTRNGLALGTAAVALTMALYPLGHSVATFSLLYVLWAFGWAMDTGAREAWLYRILTERDAADSYARVAGRGETVLLLGSVVTTASAGVLFVIDPAVPFVANALLTTLGLGVLATLPDPAGHAGAGFARGDIVRALAVQIARPDIRWFVVYLALFYTAFEVTRAFEQPAAVDVGVPVALLGLLFSGFKLASAGAAWLAGPVNERFGARPVFMLFVPTVIGLYALVLVVPVLVVVVFFLARSLDSVTAPIRNQYVNDRIGDVGRATVLSGISMTVSLAGATAHAVGYVVTPRLGAVTSIALAGVLLGIAGAVVWLATAPVRSTDASHGEAAAEVVSAA